MLRNTITYSFHPPLLRAFFSKRNILFLEVTSRQNSQNLHDRPTNSVRLKTSNFLFIKGVAMTSSVSLNGQQVALLEELYSLYRLNVLTDVVLAVDQLEIPCHRVVLAASSPYFR